MLEKRVDAFELAYTARGLQIAHAIAVANRFVQKALAAGMGHVSQLAGTMRDSIVISDEHAAFPGSDDFIAVEAEAANVAHGATWLSLVTAAMSFCGVLDDRNAGA